MLAAVFEGVGRPLAIRRVPDPAPGSGELLLAVRSCGVCGSDIHATSHDNAAFGQTLPAGTILGHEFAGEVVAIGRDADGWSVGDRAAGFPIFSCDACDACRDGRPANCRTARFAGLSGAQGGYAEYVRIPSRTSLRIGDDTEFTAAAMIEPFAVCLHAAGLAGELSGESVLIVGAGPIGLLLALLCRRAGARHVVVGDIAGDRVNRALLLGATAAIDASKEDMKGTFRAAAGRRPGVVFDAAGGQDGVLRAMHLAGQGARIVVVAVSGRPSTVSGMTGFAKELIICFAKAYTFADYREAHRLIVSGEVELSPAITDIVGFGDFPRMFDSLCRPSGRGKVIFDPTL